MKVPANSQTTNKFVNEAASDSARVSGQDRKIPPARGTNQIAGFGGFCPLASLEKNKEGYFWDFIYGHLCTTIIGFVYFTQEITRTQTKSRLSAGSLGTRLRGSQVGEVGEVCGNLLPLRRIFDNFRSLLNFTENSRRCSNDLWALKDTITSECFSFVRTQSHHSRPFWNIFVEIELNFRHYSCVK